MSAQNAEIDATDAMVTAAMVEYRTSDLDGRALVRGMIRAALSEQVIRPGEPS